MIAYNQNNAINYGQVIYGIPAANQSAGSNSFTFNGVFALGVDTYKNFIDAGYAVCPLQFIILNNSDQDYEDCIFSSAGDYNNPHRLQRARWTIFYAIDKNTPEVVYQDNLTTYLTVTFTANSVADLLIVVNFTYFK